MKKIILIFLILDFNLWSREFEITSDQGKISGPVMVTESLKNVPEIDKSDGGYPQAGKLYNVTPEVTRFSNENGVVGFSEREGIYKYRFRKYGLKDSLVTEPTDIKKQVLKIETDPNELANQKPANYWLGALDIGTQEDKIIFKMQCGFCHQQGSSFVRSERDEADWEDVIKRMIRYGSRLPSDLQEKLPKVLSKNYQDLVNNPSVLAPYVDWDPNLSGVEISEWPIGDSMSQTHDMLVAKNGNVYIGDNIQDRLYEFNPKTNDFVIYKIPHLEEDTQGGLIAARISDFPSHDSTSNAHSLAESEVDGHIFITPSAQQRLVEFDPETKKFTLHQMEEGFYPHTIRVDQRDNVWFTLALSNQVAKFDRKSKKFTYYDLPARSFKEKIITRNIKWIFKIMGWGIPLSNWLKIDRISSGVPLVYGIDITPNGKVWFTRLHTKEIGMIDPETNEIIMIPTPFHGPRRLRSDKLGNIWISVFGESKIAEYNPQSKQFKKYDLPVIPLGSETPYALNVDKKRNRVWVNGNQSDSIYVFDIDKREWSHKIALPRKVTFTRDVEFAADGSAYTANSNFPSWHIEDEQPTLIHIKIPPRL